MVNSKHSVKLESTPKIDLCSSSRKMNDSQATSATSGTNEDKKTFKKTVKKFLPPPPPSPKKTMKQNHSPTSLETLPNC